MHDPATTGSGPPSAPRPWPYFDADGRLTDLAVKALEIGYRQISDELKRAEEQEHRVAFVACSLLLLVSSWAFTVQPPANLGPAFPGVLFGVSVFILLFAVVTCRYLLDNGRTAMLLFRDLIRVEEILGFHQKDVFVTAGVVNSPNWEPTPFDQPTVFSPEGKQWALRREVRGTWPHLCAVGLTGLAGAGALATRGVALLL